MNALSLFNDWLNGDNYGSVMGFSSAPSLTVPNVDVTQEKDSYILEMDLPGRTENDVNLELNDRVLTISSAKIANEKKEIQPTQKEDDNFNNDDNSEEKPQYLLRERRSSEFKRSFTLPKDIDSESVSAGFKNGVLTVRIPRKPEAQPRKIQIDIA